jgi:hypothetical protein
MRLWTSIANVTTIGSDSPVRRLILYYAAVCALVFALVHFVPIFNVLFSGERLDELSSAPRLLQDGLEANQFRAPVIEISDRLRLAITTFAAIVGTVVLMLPVSWVYMSTRRLNGYNQAIVQTLIILPIAVCGIVLIVRNSLALAFSLAGIVAGVRFRASLRDARDAVFIFLAIGVGLAAGVQALTVALLLSLSFNFVLLMIWRSDFGRSVLEPTAAGPWVQPLQTLAEANGSGDGSVADRDLLLALSPKKAEALAVRFQRVRDLMVAGPGKKKPRYNAVLWVTTDEVREAQVRVERVLNAMARRWQLDEVVTAAGKPSALYYLARIRKATPPEELITAVRAEGGQFLKTAELELSTMLQETTDT